MSQVVSGVPERPAFLPRLRPMVVMAVPGNFMPIVTHRLPIVMEIGGSGLGTGNSGNANAKCQECSKQFGLHDQGPLAKRLAGTRLHSRLAAAYLDSHELIPNALVI